MKTNAEKMKRVKLLPLLNNRYTDAHHNRKSDKKERSSHSLSHLPQGINDERIHASTLPPSNSVIGKRFSIANAKDTCLKNVAAESVADKNVKAEIKLKKGPAKAIAASSKYDE